MAHEVNDASLDRGIGIGCVDRFGEAFEAVHERVSDLLCMSNLVHASTLKEHEDNDDYQ